MRLFLYLLAALATYELAVRASERFDRNDIHEDARLNRVRILNQTGQLPGEIEY